MTIAIALAIMLLLAGCSSAAAGLPFTAPPPYTDSGGELNGTALSADHLTGLEKAGSFSSRSTLVFNGQDHAIGINRSARVDSVANRSVSTVQFNSDAVEGDGFVVTSYTNESRTYRQVEIDSGQGTITRYDAASPPYGDGPLTVRPANTSRAAHTHLVAAVVEDINWTMVGVERYDGGWVTRYEASGSGNFSSIGSTAMVDGEQTTTDGMAFPETLDFDVSPVNATLLVSADGVVRLLEVNATGNAAGHPIEFRLSMATDDIGETTVEAPAWLDDARQKTDG